MSQLATASRPSQRAAVTNGGRILAVLCSRLLSVVARVMAGSSVKGTPGSRTRNGAQRVPNGWRSWAKPSPLMLMEAIEPIGKGVGQGHRPQRLPPQTVGQEPTRDATRRGLPKRSAERSHW